MCIVVTTNKRPHHRHETDYFWKGVWCRCGNAKSNLHHNATRRRYYYRQGRKLKPYFKNRIFEGET